MDPWVQSTKKQKSGGKKSPKPSPGRGGSFLAVLIFTFWQGSPTDEGPQRSTSTELNLGGQGENPADSTGYAEVWEEEWFKTHGWSGRRGIQLLGNADQQGESQLHSEGGSTVS